MKDDFERGLRSFDRVWRRVLDSRPGPPPPPMGPPPPPPRPNGLLPKKQKGCCRQRYCPR